MLPLAIGLLLAAAAQSETTLAQLSKIHLDKSKIYSVRDISLNRDALSISLNRGTIAFTETLEGKVTGAVFIGSGDILAFPPNLIEKQQLFRHTRSALLNEHFEAAVFRFTDGTYDEILKQYRSHAQEQADASDVEEILRWEFELQRRASFLNDRILADLLGVATHPFFLAQIEGMQFGWFDAVYDERRTEEVLIEQNTSNSALPIVWMSFNKRADGRDPAPTTHEDKSLFDIQSLSPDGTLRLKFKVDGERVLALPVTSSGVTRVTLEPETMVPFIAKSDELAIVLPTPTRLGEEVTLRIESLPGTVVRQRSSRPSDSVVPASYRDQWIIEGLANYLSAVADKNVLDEAREQLLQQSPEGGPYESLGPVSIGFRMGQPQTTPGYVSALKNKSLWILHMLRTLLQPDDKDAAFGRFLEDLLSQARGKSISTYDFKKLAEKHAGKPLDWFFEDWVFGTGIPAYTVNSKVDASADGFVISGNITQSRVPDTFEMPVPLYADDVLLGNVNVSSDGGEFRFMTRTRPQQILVDPKGTILTRK
jgi:hypothetical protein